MFVCVTPTNYCPLYSDKSQDFPALQPKSFLAYQ